ncbi:glycosyltransferase [Patescibacteria group bacterium]|nr:glycosyltransferase [Patescibacteria group bacterium]
MKIAIFTDTYLPEINGVSICVNLLARELSKKNTVIVFAPKYEKGNKNGNGNFKVIRCRSVPFPVYKNVRFTLPNIVSLYKTLKKFDPDIIHFHTPSSLGIASLILGKSLKVPVIATYHTMFNELLFYVSPIKKLQKIIKRQNYISKSSIDRLSSVWKKLWKGKRKKETRMEKITWRAIVEFHSLCAKIIVPSPTVKTEIDKRGLRGKTVNIPNGVDILEKFKTKNSYEVKNKVLFVGRIAEEKNIDVLIKAFKKAQEKMPTLQLTIAGDGPAVTDLKKLCKKLMIQENVNFIGMIPQNSLSQIYQEADVFVIMSTAENQALVVLEAMASGLPVIGVSKYGIVDIVKDGQNGFLVKPSDVNAAGKLIVKVVKDQDLRERLGRNSRKFAENHNIQKTTKETFRLYKTLIK